MEEFRRFRALSEQAGAERSLCARDRRRARGGERPGLHPPRRRAARHRDPRAVAGARRPIIPRSASFPASIRPDGIAGDLGGGSLELVDVNGEDDRRRHHAAAGRPAPAGHGEEFAGARLRRSRATSSRRAKAAEGRAEAGVFYAVGGTWRNLARLHMNTTELSARRHAPLRDRHRQLRRLPASRSPRAISRRSSGIEGVSKNRRALLPYGAIVLLEIIAAMKPSKIVVSALGVREGFLYSLLPQERAGRRSADLGRRGTGASCAPAR